MRVENSKIAYPALALAIMLLLGGCSKSEWWVGTWRVDRPYTEQHMVVATPAPQVSNGTNKMATAMQGLGNGLAKGMLSLMMAVMENADLTITQKQFMLLKDGAGTAKDYTVIERPSSNSVILKVGNDVSTYTLEGDHMSAAVAGVSDAKIYFKRVK
ncbi:MAG: hypothetical protein ABIP97_01100 [Chthoniobacterales bacterium]